MGCGQSTSTKKTDTASKGQKSAKEAGGSVVLKVTLVVFSGRPHPTWEIKEDHPKYKELLAKIDAHGEEEELPDFVLGYRGFHVEKYSGDRPQDAAADGTTPAPDVPTKKVKSSAETSLQELLLETASAVDDEVLTHVRESIGKAVPELTIDDAIVTTDMGIKGPQYEPAKWNENLKVLRNNNCYNYSNNIITNTFAQPGKASNEFFTQIKGELVKHAAEADGLKSLETSDNIPEPTEGNIVALVIWPGIDFHWYRRDNTGQWSHKPGSTPCLNMDNSGRHITDPRTCDRNKYTEFTCFMETVPEKVNIR